MPITYKPPHQFSSAMTGGSSAVEGISTGNWWGGKPTYTVSELEAFIRCQKEYELKYVNGIEPVSIGQEKPYALTHLRTGLPAAQWGRLIHEIFQFLDFATLGNQQTVIEQALTNQQILDSDQGVRQTIQSLIKKLRSHNEIWNLLIKMGQGIREIPFFADMGTFYLKGILDRLVLQNDSLFILDYKTDYLLSEEEAKRRTRLYHGQMACYALAASMGYPVSQIRTSLLFTSVPALVSYDWPLALLDEAKKKLMTIHETLMNKPLATTYPVDLSICPHCPYFELNYCGVKSLPNISQISS